jgi:peptidyl-tRNA hydrolase, PTH1 family
VIELVIFLGNPGDRYSRTRHNAGRLVLDAISLSETPSWKEKFHGRCADIRIAGRKCRFLVPETFMNLSGKSVAAAATFFKAAPEELLIVHDDLEIPFGSIGLRSGGGLAGHNGLKSIRDDLGTAGFWRLRIGIGRPDRGSVRSWVLGRFSPDEEPALPVIMERAAEMLEEAITSPGDLPDIGSKIVKAYG